MPTITVVVDRDGNIYHQETTDRHILEKLAVRTPHLLHWDHIIRQMKDHPRPFKVRLIVGDGRDGFEYEEMIFRSVNKQPHVPKPLHKKRNWRVRH